MGKLYIKILYEGKDVKELTPEQRFSINSQPFEIIYNTDKMNKIEFNGDDYTIEIDFQNLSNNLDWNSLEYPNQMVKERVLEIVYYNSILIELEKIKQDISHFGFGERFELEKLANNALNILISTKKSNYYPRVNNHIKEGITDIEYTISKEVRFLNDVKDNLSQIKKNSTVNEAKEHLGRYLKQVISGLENYNINDE